MIVSAGFAVYRVSVGIYCEEPAFLNYITAPCFLGMHAYLSELCVAMVVIGIAGLWVKK